MEGQPIGQGGRGGLVLADPLVEEDEPYLRRPGLRQPVPLHPETPGIEGGGEMRGGALPHPLGHRGDEKSPIGLSQQPGLGHRPPGAKRRREVEPADQPILGDPRRHPP